MWRKYHRIVSLIIVLPFALVLITGLLLQLRQQFEGIQPSAVKMQAIKNTRLLTNEEIIQASYVKAEDIDQIIFRPAKFHKLLRVYLSND